MKYLYLRFLHWQDNIELTLDLQTGDDEESNDSNDDMIAPGRVKAAWNELYRDSSHLLFGSSNQRADVSTLHPEQIQIFRFWQIYLDNVNPLLKVTHTPTLQARLIDAASDMTRIKPELVALMFSIYCVSIMSLSEDECPAMFGSSKEALLAKYQSGCQQALINCGFMRSVDRDCLTALFLYLVSLPSPNVIIGLTTPDLDQTRRGSRIPVFHARRGDPHCTTYGPAPRSIIWQALHL